MSKPKSRVPEWIREYRRRTMLIEAIAKAYEIECDCEVCQMIREVGDELGEVFLGGGSRSRPS